MECKVCTFRKMWVILTLIVEQNSLVVPELIV